MNITEFTKAYFKLNKEEQDAFKIIIGQKSNPTKVIPNHEVLLYSKWITDVEECKAKLIEDIKKKVLRVRKKY